MSAETLDYLNENVMFGFAASRSTWGEGTSFGSGLKPWFANEHYQHLYQDGIPVEAVIDNLFYWEPQESELFVRLPVEDVEVADGIDHAGRPYKEVVDPDRKAIVRQDTGDILGIFGKTSYQVHGYRQWLIDNVAHLLDSSSGDLGISSAGLLRRGGQAWVSIELPEDIEVEGAGHVRPCIIAATSCDGTLATTYAIRIMRPECDNSLRISLSATGDGGTLKIKHSAKSMGRLTDARAALSLVHQAGDTAVSWFNELADVDITDEQFRQITKRLHPVPDPVMAKGKVTNIRSINNAEERQSELLQMYTRDPRAAGWNGTLAGAYHAVSTHQQHMVSRDDVAIRRIMVGTLSGAYDKAEDQFWSVVEGMGIYVPDQLNPVLS
jgi:phage/plasmid-like protein (TIGR03299 family)